ncbi:hypothetical protein [uncultured Thiodictyon sp.]|uniref:hypothetical protein n=1 Tax=uncultured Thiodictyon sp. TaxID=1846217 RepID=UPI0025F53DE8|nr:hypothetical protein [uncultured Thiodictyon sp.]
MTQAVTQTVTPDNMRSVANLWGSLPEVSPVLAPVAILREQGQMLAQATKGLLYAEARFQPASSGFEVAMRIVAPSLNNYTYEILRVGHGVELYPAWVTADAEPIECHDERAFEEAVAKVLQSDRVRRAISGLLAQIQAN